MGRPPVRGGRSPCPGLGPCLCPGPWAVSWPWLVPGPGLSLASASARVFAIARCPGLWAYARPGGPPSSLVGLSLTPWSLARGPTSLFMVEPGERRRAKFQPAQDAVPGRGLPGRSVSGPVPGTPRPTAMAAHTNDLARLGTRTGHTSLPCRTWLCAAAPEQGAPEQGAPPHGRGQLSVGQTRRRTATTRPMIVASSPGIGSKAGLAGMSQTCPSRCR
jgi:hypothetical protein